MSKLSHTRDKIYKTVARQMHGVVPCWVCGEHVQPAAATLEHIKPLSEGGNSHLENLAISHDVCNNQRHATGTVTASLILKGCVQRRFENELFHPIITDSQLAVVKNVIALELPGL